MILHARLTFWEGNRQDWSCGTNANEAKVLKAHAAPQGSCGNYDQRAEAAGEPADGW